MRIRAVAHTTALLIFSLAAATVSHAQSAPTATQTFNLSVFGGATGTWIGLDQGRNLGITAGVDLGAGSFFGLHPAVEVRGTYAVDNGDIAGERNALAGIKLTKPLGRLHPYVNVLFGRGEINYQNSGYLNAAGTLYYLQSLSNVLSPGGGVDVTVTEHFSFKADLQYQHYDVPVTTSGSLYSTAVTAGVVYRIDFNHRKHYREQ